MNNLTKSIEKYTKRHPWRQTFKTIFMFVSFFAAIDAAYRNDLTVTLFWSLILLSENIAVSIDGIWRVLQSEDE